MASRPRIGEDLISLFWETGRLVCHIHTDMIQITPPIPNMGIYTFQKYFLFCTDAFSHTPFRKFSKFSTVNFAKRSDTSDIVFQFT